MKNLFKELIKENKNILHTYPNIKDNLRTSAGHRYMFNKEMISKLELLIIAEVSQQREILNDFVSKYNASTEKFEGISEDSVDCYFKGIL
jgi:CO dehydrogenase/acetyl-CoA synthase beta subunit